MTPPPRKIIESEPLLLSCTLRRSISFFTNSMKAWRSVVTPLLLASTVSALHPVLHFGACIYSKLCRVLAACTQQARVSIAPETANAWSVSWCMQLSQMATARATFANKREGATVILPDNLFHVFLLGSCCFRGFLLFAHAFQGVYNS